MTWNIASECVCVVILSIIWVYSKKGNPISTIKSKLFHLCFLITFCSMTSNILSTILIYSSGHVPPSLTYIVTFIYFIITPLMGMVYYCYTASLVIQNEKILHRIIVFSSIPAILYIIFLLFNISSNLIFSVDKTGNYYQGSYIYLTYIIFYLYCVLCAVIVLCNLKKLNKSLRKILLVFPILAMVVILVQSYIPEYTLTGSAATCVLLILYLYLENKQITVDYLTNLNNRHYFLQTLEIKINKKKSNDFGIIVISLKSFKSINKQLGQGAGNVFLEQISDFLLATFDKKTLFRYGGDEFALIINDVSESNIKGILSKINKRMESPFTYMNYSVTLSFATGIVLYNDKINNVESMINAVEFSVSQAKLDNASNCVFCTEDMLQKLNRKDEVFSYLKNKLDNNSLEIFYQPIYDVSSEKFLLAESLMRLRDTPLGNITPDEFIPIAENTGLIVPLTYNLIENVCKHIKTIFEHKKGLQFEGISINLSVVQFTDELAAENILAILKKHDISPNLIKFEITESTLVDNFSKVKQFMHKMHVHGALFGLDDFGTGYSNISSVLQLPWNTVKIDKSLLKLAMIHDNYAKLLKNFMNAFADFGLRVLIEGVENDEQNQYCLDCGCDMLQGFLYAKPMPELDFLEFINKN